MCARTRIEPDPPTLRFGLRLLLMVWGLLVQHNPNMAARLHRSSKEHHLCRDLQSGLRNQGLNLIPARVPSRTSRRPKRYAKRSGANCSTGRNRRSVPIGR
jgi:hypothetical protein